MPRYRHWKNFGDGGSTVFVTTTVLDFVPVFRNTHLSDEMVNVLFEVHSKLGAALHAFVVMPNHIHFMLRLPEGMHISSFVRALKSISARRIQLKLD